MADNRVYTLDQLDELEQTNEENVTQAHLTIAMDYVIRILEDSNIPYAVMGGMHMIMRGYADRSTTDVDIAVQSNPRSILRTLESDPRIFRPRVQSVAGSGVARIFVATGPAYGENVAPLAVEVDLILSGNRGAPRQLNDRNVIEISWNGSGRTRRYSILNLKEILKAKLSAYYQRESTNDFRDLMWMCRNLADRVRTVSDRLDQDQREFFLEAFSANTSASRNDIDRLRHILNL